MSFQLQNSCLQANRTRFQNGSPFCPVKAAHWSAHQDSLLPHTFQILGPKALRTDFLFASWLFWASNKIKIYWTSVWGCLWRSRKRSSQFYSSSFSHDCVWEVQYGPMWFCTDLLTAQQCSCSVNSIYYKGFQNLNIPFNFLFLLHLSL